MIILPEKIIYSKRRSIALEVTKEGKFIVRAPKRVSNKLLQDLILQKQNWIEAKVQFSKLRFSRPKPINFSLEKIRIFNQLYNVNYELKNGWHNVCLVNSSETIYLGRFKKAINKEEVLFNLFKEFIKNCFEFELNRISKKHGFSYNGLKLSKAKTKWGSCTFNNTIFLNYKLIHASYEWLEYVCVHELCHTVHKNHSVFFWGLVQSCLPNFKQVRKDLKLNEQKL